MEKLPRGTVTHLLKQASEGRRSALDDLFPLVYQELRGLAAGYIFGERPDHSLQPTALVHEAYLKLVRQSSAGWKTRAQFFGVAAKVMRRLLVDHARGRAAIKRGGGAFKSSLDECAAMFQQRAIDLVALDEALDRLVEIHGHMARVVEMRFFGGMSHEEVAEVLGSTERTVRRDWVRARAWLRAELADFDPSALSVDNDEPPQSLA
ncbi:MAG: sigma-70 family RNA polymerase sigma factor [Planctomycetota bacterium]